MKWIFKKLSNFECVQYYCAHCQQHTRDHWDLKEIFHKKKLKAILYIEIMTLHYYTYVFSKDIFIL